MGQRRQPRTCPKSVAQRLRLYKEGEKLTVRLLGLTVLLFSLVWISSNSLLSRRFGVVVTLQRVRKLAWFGWHVRDCSIFVYC